MTGTTHLVPACPGLSRCPGQRALSRLVPACPASGNALKMQENTLTYLLSRQVGANDARRMVDRTGGGKEYIFIYILPSPGHAPDTKPCPGNTDEGL